MKIPQEFIEEGQLYNMKVGESGYIVPWGMWVTYIRTSLS